jgi:hypothetical protein
MLVTTSLLLVAGVNERSIGRWCKRAKYWLLVLMSEVLAAGVNERSIGRWC